MQEVNYKQRRMITVAVLAVAVFFFYETWCPLERIFGIPCPGCNMLSAVYHLLHGDIQTALYFHPLVIAFCIYALIELLLYFKNKSFKSKAAYYLRIIMILLLGIVYVYRMLTIFPDYPMLYNNDSFLARILPFIH